ncbi:hypothetical protein D3C76_1526860 [compost metagenome]
MLFTEPLEAAVVVTVQSTLAVVPKRLSLPSSGAPCSTGSAASDGFGWCSLHSDTPRPRRNSASMQPRMARLWRRSFT